jgi:carbon monoxide dehydrogenase subunit G
LHFEGKFDSRADPARLFSTLTDPKELSGCMPGLQKLDVTSSMDFTAVVKAGVGFIKGDFAIKFTIADRREPSHAKLIGRGTGMGSAVDIEAWMDISPATAGGSSMKWAADASVGGKLASLGQRLLEGQAEKIIKEMFGCLQSKFDQA